MSGSSDDQRLQAECTLHLARYLERDPKVTDPFDFWCAAFFAGADVQAVAPRSLGQIERELEFVRERSARVRQESAMRTTDPDPKPLGPLGERVQRQNPPTPARDKAVPGAPSGIVEGADGRMRTTTHRRP